MVQDIFLVLTFSKLKNKKMISESAIRLKEMISKAIEDHKITPDEFDQIINLASEDGNIDHHERVLLQQLQEMIENKMVRWSPK